jgi:hypothetical protein
MFPNMSSVFFFNQPTISANVYLDMLELYILRRVSAVDNFPTRWCISTLGFTCSSVFGCIVSKQVDWERWYVKDKMFSTPVPDTQI